MKILVRLVGVFILVAIFLLPNSALVTASEDWVVYMTVTTNPDVGSVPGEGSHFGFGAKDGASDGYDSGEGDEIAPPDPLVGINAYFYYPANPPFQKNLIMSVTGPAISIIWPLVVKMVGETGDTSMTISWPDISSVPAKYVVLELQDTGGSTLANMKSVDHYTFSASQGQTYEFNVVALENTSPVVSSVSATQRSDGSGVVEISYGVSDSEQATVDVSLEYWDPSASWHSCTNTTGDVGSGINTGTGKVATWDAKAQLGPACISGCKVRVTADDGAGGSDSVESNTFDLDIAPPTGYGCASPANEAECVSIDVALVCSTASDDSLPVSYYFQLAEDDAFSVGLQESGWQQSTNWTPATTLSYGTTYWWRVKARDAENNESAWSSPFTFVTIYKFDLALKSGWNMISLPLENCTGETDPAVILPDVEVIYTWNCETTSYDSPSAIIPGKGYWALVFENTTETIYGTPVEEYQLSSACEGWHMVSSLYVEGQVNVTYGSVYDTLYHWNPETLSYIARPLDDVRPGEGYWLLAFTDFSISVVPKSP